MKDIKIAYLIKGVLFFLCAFIVAISLLSVHSMYNSEDLFSKLGIELSNVRYLRRMSDSLNVAKVQLTFLRDNEKASHEDIDARLKIIREAVASGKDYADKFNAVAVSKEEEKLANDVYKNSIMVVNEFLSDVKLLESYTVFGLSDETTSSYATFASSMDAYGEFSVAFGESIISEFESAFRSFIILSISSLVFAIVFSIFAFWIIRRNVFDRLVLARLQLDNIGAGELFHEFDVGARNEIGFMLQSLKNMQSSLVKTISSVRHSSGEMKNNSAEIEDSNQALASRTEQQASALQETASSMEQIKTTVSNNAENARQANELAHQARSTADTGSAVMINVVSTMDKISQSARKISEINRVIDGIANQTNILALNAAVEAARAGEQGRGFSVVATEVRNLAKRSADAAKEISYLIDQSVENVDDGAKLVEDAGKTMQEIVTSVTYVSDIMQEITQASEEQSTGIGQIASAVNEMDLATQQNATMVENSSIITRNMAQQAKELFDAVSMFRVEPGHMSRDYDHDSGRSRRVNTVKNDIKGRAEANKENKDSNMTAEGEWTTF